jgi:dCMP deaminase
MEKQYLRPTWENYAMNLAEVAMLRSEDPYQKVGACILGHNKEVLAVAYNGLASGKEAPKDFWVDRDRRRPYMIHAETNALSRIKRGDGLLLACTLLPCSCCATNIAAYNIKHVFYKEIYKLDKKALDIFNFYGIECTKLQ